MRKIDGKCRYYSAFFQPKCSVFFLVSPASKAFPNEGSGLPFLDEGISGGGRCELPANFQFGHGEGIRN